MGVMRNAVGVHPLLRQLLMRCPNLRHLWRSPAFSFARERRISRIGISYPMIELRIFKSSIAVHAAAELPKSQYPTLVEFRISPRSRDDSGSRAIHPYLPPSRV